MNGPFESDYTVPKHSALNVCFFSHSPLLCGAERSLLELVDELIADHGALCTVVLPSPGPLSQRLEQIGARCIVGDYGWWCLPLMMKVADFEANIQACATRLLNDLLIEIKKIDPDVIWTQTLVHPWGAAVAALLKKPHVWSVCEYGELDQNLNFWPSFSQVIADIIASSHLIYTNSKGVTEKLFPNLSVDQCKTVYRHINPQELKSENVTHYYKVPGALKVAVIASLMRGKGQGDMVLALAELLKQGHNVELLLAGAADHDYLQYIKQMIDELKLENRIQIPGFLENPYLAIQCSDVIVICSRLEAFGRIAVEAMLMGKPVVYPEVGGFVEYMIDGQTGLGYPSKDIKALVEKIEILIHDPDLRHSLGKYAQTYAEEKFTRQAYGGVVFHDLLQLTAKELPKVAMPSSLAPFIYSSMVDSQQNLINLKQETDSLKQEVESLKQKTESLNQEILQQQAQTVDFENQLKSSQYRSMELDNVLKEAMLTTQYQQATIQMMQRSFFWRITRLLCKSFTKLHWLSRPSRNKI